MLPDSDFYPLIHSRKVEGVTLTAGLGKGTGNPTSSSLHFLMGSTSLHKICGWGWQYLVLPVIDKTP